MSNWSCRLVEVNGVLVVNSTQEEVTNLLLQGPSAQIVVLRQPPPTPSSQQHPLLPQHMVSPGPIQTICQERDVVTMETPPQRKVMAIWWYEGQKQKDNYTVVMRMGQIVSVEWTITSIVVSSFFIHLSPIVNCDIFCIDKMSLIDCCKMPFSWDCQWLFLCYFCFTFFFSKKSIHPHI